MTSQIVREAWFRYIRMSQQEKVQFHKLIGTKDNLYNYYNKDEVQKSYKKDEN